jgi:integrase/recombinase XerD
MTSFRHTNWESESAQRGSAATVDLRDLARQFINFGRYLRGWTPKTISTYEHGLGLFLQFLGDSRGLTQQALDQWIVWMRQRGLSPGGCNTHIRTVNSFLSWLGENHYASPDLRIKLLRKPRSVPRLMSRLEVWKLLGSKPPNDITKLRTWALIGLLVDTGARIEEALTLRVDEVKFDALQIRFTGKGGHERVVPFSQEGRKMLLGWLAERERRARWPGAIASPYLFSVGDGGHLAYRNAYRDIKTFSEWKGVNGSHIHPHAFRNYFAVGYLQNGGDLFTLSKILGHTSVSTTQIYLKSMGIEQIGEVHGRVSPLQNLKKGKPPGER